MKPTSRSTPIDKVLSYKINYTIICSELYLELYRVHVNLSFLIYTCLGRFYHLCLKRLSNWTSCPHKCYEKTYANPEKKDYPYEFSGTLKLRIFSRSTVYQDICPILSDKNSLLGYDDRPRLHSNV